MDTVSPSGTLDASCWISASTSSWHSIKTSTIAWFAFCRFSLIRVPLFNTPEFSDKSPKVSPGSMVRNNTGSISAAVMATTDFLISSLCERAMPIAAPAAPPTPPFTAFANEAARFNLNRSETAEPTPAASDKLFCCSAN